ncbi:MAG: T9SS type A sorting domain-containing protein [Bacteroidales bacterium]
MNYHPAIFESNIEEKTIKATANLSDLVDVDIAILPNPAKDYITLTYNLPTRKVYVLRIYDIKGIQVYALTLDGNKGMQTLDLRLFKTGTYFYSVTNNKNMIKSDKLIIAK